jgi:hypothetical protein
MLIGGGIVLSQYPSAFGDLSRLDDASTVLPAQETANNSDLEELKAMLPVVTTTITTTLPVLAPTPTDGRSESQTTAPTEMLTTTAGNPTPVSSTTPSSTTLLITPTTVPSLTPIIEGTSTLQEPLLERFVDDTFDSAVSGWPVRETSTASAAYVDGRYQLTLNGQTTIGVSTFLPTPNYRLSLDVTIGEGSAGIVFLSAEPTTFYHFVVSTDGAYAIQMLDQVTNRLSNVVDWTQTAVVQRGAGATNRLRVERRGPQVTFFVNDQLLTEFPIPPGQVTNQYGFALTSPTAQGQASLDNLVGERLPDS